MGTLKLPPRVTIGCPGRQQVSSFLFRLLNLLKFKTGTCPPVQILEIKEGISIDEIILNWLMIVLTEDVMTENRQITSCIDRLITLAVV